jgi:polyisoprenoid-binding protein YceI
MKSLVLISFLLLHLGTRAQAVQLKADRAKSYIRYHMKHAVHSWTGISKDLGCVVQLNDKDEIEKVAATVKVKSFDSDNSNRDSHMLEVTDALTYPSISFYSTSITKNSPASYTVKGVLNFHGVDRPIVFEVAEERSGKERKLKGGFMFLLEDHKIERPSLFMVKTDNEVKVELFVVF